MLLKLIAILRRCLTGCCLPWPHGSATLPPLLKDWSLIHQQPSRVRDLLLRATPLL